MGCYRIWAYNHKQKSNPDWFLTQHWGVFETLEKAAAKITSVIQYNEGYSFKIEGPDGEFTPWPVAADTTELEAELAKLKGLANG